jgi:hypothetical protein
LLGAAQDNESGFWEPEELHRINDKFLARLGTSWDDWRPIRLDELNCDGSSEWRQQFARLVRDEFNSAQLIALKDPRICRFAPLCLEILSDLGIAVSVIVPFRNPLEVAASLKHRNGFSWEKSFLLWLRHVLDVEIASREYSRAFVNYDQLLDNWRRASDAIAQHLRLDWPRDVSEVSAEIEEFLSPSLRHHTHTLDELKVPGARAWAINAFDALLSMEASPDDRRAHRQVDRLRSEFESVSELFGPEIARISAEQESLAKDRRARIDSPEAEINDQQNLARQRAEKIAMLESQLSEQHLLAQQRADKIATLETKISDQQNLAQRRADRIATLEQQILDSRQQLRVYRDEFQNLENRFNCTQHELN